MNFLVLLGWSTSDSRDIFSPEELIEAFSLEGLGRTNAIFDIRKDDPKFFTDPRAISINAHYLRNMPLEELAPYVKAELEKAGIWDPAHEAGSRDWFLRTVDLIRTRFHLLTDFVSLGRAYFSDEYPLEPKGLEKNILKHEALKEWFGALADRLEALETFDPVETERVIRRAAEDLATKPGVLINGIRMAVTGQAVGPGLFEVLAAIGRERVVARLRKAPALFERHGDPTNR